MLHLIADRLDLAIDLLTLGQYGLEQAPPRDPHCTAAIDCRYRQDRPAARRRGAHPECPPRLFSKRVARNRP